MLAGQTTTGSDEILLTPGNEAVKVTLAAGRVAWPERTGDRWPAHLVNVNESATKPTAEAGAGGAALD
jgi:hypothetical protein